MRLKPYRHLASLAVPLAVSARYAKKAIPGSVGRQKKLTCHYEGDPSNNCQRSLSEQSSYTYYGHCRCHRRSDRADRISRYSACRWGYLGIFAPRTFVAKRSRLSPTLRQRLALSGAARWNPQYWWRLPRDYFSPAISGSGRYFHFLAGLAVMVTAAPNLPN